MPTIADVFLVCLLGAVCAWVFHNLHVLIVGVRSLRRSLGRLQGQDVEVSLQLPKFSIVVPVKNEEKVVGRLLEALSSLRYPTRKMEIVIVEDGSTDSTLEICRRFAGSRSNVKLLRRPVSNGKPGALNYALAHCSGDAVAFFDADNVPSKDVLLKAARYFEDSTVMAVQGLTLSINSAENMLTKFLSYEEIVWSEVHLRGKDSLGLFVNLKGSCQFVRKTALESIGGFDENSLAEDLEISTRLAKKGYRIRYAGDVQSWQESPAKVKTFLKQRTRWVRGQVDIAFKYGELMRHPNRMNLDIETTLFSPIIGIVTTFALIVASWADSVPVFSLNLFLRIILNLLTLATMATLLIIGFSLMYVSKPKRASNLRWLPFVFGYWSFQAFLTVYAMLLTLFRRPRNWVKTEKTGVVSPSEFKSAREA